MENTDPKFGLSENEAKARLLTYGKNELNPEKKESFFRKAFHIISEPMFILLIVAAVIYFILGEARDGAIMFIFVIGMILIDVIQEWKTDKTLNALKNLSAPCVKVIRDGKEKEIASSFLVPGDIMMVSEGMKIAADGKILKASDFSTDESTLTGEAMPVVKNAKDLDETDDSYFKNNLCYAGTLVTQGFATVLVEKTGASTEYGKIGENVTNVPEGKTPLQKQTGALVKTCTGIAAVLFALVSGITYLNLALSGVESPFVDSILSGITLAMATIPEEFPVILTVFLSMGAWRLAKKNSLVRRLPSVETLGAVSVLCVDKTGTITMNQMTVSEIFSLSDRDALIETMGLACETEAYDPMEKAMLKYCEENGAPMDHLFGGKMITEYAFTNENKMMGHVWEHDGEIIIAAKGSPEKLLTLCDITESKMKLIDENMTRMSEQGLRVIAVGIMRVNDKNDIPNDLNNCQLELLGLCGLYDPPRESVKDDIRNARHAGIRVVMITGDNGLTARSIAREVGMDADGGIITGAELMEMDDLTLRERVKNVSIFSRVIPEHKMRIVKAFKDNGEIVAMTGDGVNDAPALKLADIGIAMGRRGSEVSREASDIVLMDDNFSTIVDTIRDGRRIYDNIQKAVGYVFTVHVPILLMSLIAPMLGIGTGSLLLLPLHVVLLELIIDPTCSIVLERQPAESNIMDRPPRSGSEKLLKRESLIMSVIQGIVIFIAAFGTYYFTLKNGGTAELSRTLGIGIMMIANIFLVQVNSSKIDYAYTTFKKLLKDKVMWVASLSIIAGFLLISYSPLNGILKLSPLSLGQLSSVFLIAAASVFWIEFVKIIKNKMRKS
ncbi:MAG: cation-translocating P-type ATPase [Clostridia bacterium]